MVPGKDVSYGMGLMVDTTYGVPMVHHGGDLTGYHSDMIWVPQQNVDACIHSGFFDLLVDLAASLDAVRRPVRPPCART